jgi:hypothetical protein
MISGYLRELSEALRFDPALSARVLPEVRDHLEEALAAEPLENRQEAERRVIERFGDPRELAAQFAPISLSRHIRRAGVALLVATVAVMVLMKARVFWYALVQWTLTDEARSLAQLVVSVDRDAFWLAAAIGIASLFYIARYPTPLRAGERYRRRLREAAWLFGFATALLGISVASDLVLAGLQFRSDVHALVPIASVALEIACIGVIAFLVANAARRLAHTESSLLK